MRKMKDSGIEWVGEIPEDWGTRRIKTLFQLRNEKSFKPLSDVNLISLYTDKGVLQHSDIEYVAGNKASNADGYKCVYENDIVVNIILCWMGAIGQSSYNGVTSPAYDIYKPNGCTNSRFYHYYFRTKGFNGECFQRGRGIMLMRWRTYSEDFMDIKVCYPPLSEQQRIADFLDDKVVQIDSVISKTRETIEEYKKLKQSIITEAVTGKVKIENGKVKESEMLELKGDNLPNGWRWMKLKFLIDKNLQYGANDSGIEYNPILPRYVRITDIDSNGKLKNDEMLSLSEENSKDYFLEEGDILFARSGASVGKTFIYKAEYGRCCFAGYLIRAKLNKKIINPQFFFYYTLSSKYDIWKNGIFIQSTIQNIGADKYSNLEVPVPTLNSQLSLITFLDKKCSEIDKLITKKEQLVVELEAYKKSLIYEVVTGKKECVGIY